MSASARVQVTLLVSDLGTWGEDCTVSQIRKQAMEEARGKVSRLLRDKGSSDIKVLGDLSVVNIIFGEEK